MKRFLSVFAAATLVAALLPCTALAAGVNASQYLAPYTSVKNQADFDDCWGFGTVAALESSYLLAHDYSSGLQTGVPEFSTAALVYATRNGATSDGTTGGPALTNSYNDYIPNTASSVYGFCDGLQVLPAIATLANGSGVVDLTEVPHAINSKTGVPSMVEAAANNYYTSHLRLKNADALPPIYPIYTTPRADGIIVDKTYGDRADASAEVWKEALRTHGALAAGMALLDYKADDGAYYHRGCADASTVYAEEPNFWYFAASTEGDGTEVLTNAGHIICIVGYDDAYSRYNFAQALKKADGTNFAYDKHIAEVVTLYADPVYNADGSLANDPTTPVAGATGTDYIVPLGDGAWIIKNSYGTGNDQGLFGDNGIFHVSYYERTLTGAYAFELEDYVYDAAESPADYALVYQHDGVAPVPYYGDDQLKGANVFTAKAGEDASEIQAVGVTTSAANTEMLLQFYLDISDTNDPESGTFMGEQNITVQYAGYHTITLDEPLTVEPGHTISVVASFTSTDDLSRGNPDFLFRQTGTYVPLEQSENSYPDGATIYTYAGNTLLYENGAWIDTTVKNDAAKDSSNKLGNMTVKLLGNPVPAAYTPENTNNANTTKASTSSSGTTTAKTGDATAPAAALLALTAAAAAVALCLTKPQRRRK
ncbi:MAG: lectin like domain-containing protein [Coriobacteriia bacterium]|nr:lectin like domain-containing protein [Coriobacteriia bacterium]